MNRYTTSPLIMQSTMINNHIRLQFRSILKILIHFSFSLVQLLGAFAVLGLQIVLTVTQTCAFRIGAGFWAFPFLLAAPISIWFLLWRRTSVYCVLAFFIHICATLFATGVIIVSFLALINIIGSPCSGSSSSNIYLLAFNGSLIGAAGLFKVFAYGEIFTLYILLRNTDQSSSLFKKTIHEKNYQFISDETNINSWRQLRAGKDNRVYKDNNDFDV